MFRFLESICFKSGSYQLLELHQQRVYDTFRYFFPHKTPTELNQVLPDLGDNKKFKVRLEYDSEKFNVQVAEYHTKNIKQLKIIECGKIDYNFKFADRSRIEELYNQKGVADDILIIREGFVTDSSYANVIFRKNGDWFTPRSRLLNGVKRQYLLDHQLIREEDIELKDIKNFSEISLINAMLDPGDIVISIDQIIY